MSMRRMGRMATNKNPRITPEGRAEHALLQSQAVQIGQIALEQAGIDYETTAGLPGGGTLGRTTLTDGEVTLDVVLRVRVNTRTTSVIGIETK